MSEVIKEQGGRRWEGSLRWFHDYAGELSKFSAVRAW
jgi:hypothetical protein